MNILHFAGDDITSFNSSRWRICNAADVINQMDSHQVRIYSVAEWLRQTELAKMQCDWADIIVIQRIMIKESVEAARHWINRGKTVIVDWDDSYEEVDENNPAHDFWKKRKINIHAEHFSYNSYLDYDPLQQFAKGLEQITGGTTPSRVIVDDYISRTNVRWLPNFIDPSKYTNCTRQDHGDEIWIGWGGSMGHIQSWTDSGIVPALRELMLKHKNVRLLMIGDNRILKHLKLPEGRILFRPYVQYFQWGNMLADMDIAVAPLWGPFDRRRSFLKAVESCVAKLPLVATGDGQYTVYEEFFDCPSHIYVSSERTVESNTKRTERWFDALDEMVDNLKDYQRAANNKGFDRGMAWSVEENKTAVIKVYQELMSLP